MKITNMFNFNYEDDSDNDFGIILNSRGAPNPSTEFVGSKDDGESGEPDEILNEYGVDLNHNAGKIVMKLVKK